MIANNTLRLTRPFGRTLGLTLVLLALVLGAAEMVTRTEQFQSFLVPPSMDSRHYALGRKLVKLETLFNQYATIECIIVGNSMVDLGFDPR